MDCDNLDLKVRLKVLKVSVHLLTNAMNRRFANLNIDP